MPVLVVTFKLDGLDDAAYQAHAEQSAAMFAGLPGLRSKVWLANQQTNTYGGVYTWDDVDSMKAYKDGEILEKLRANPHMSDVTVEEFSVLDEPTKVTRGHSVR